jgi:Ca-activated chloride channel family protein
MDDPNKLPLVQRSFALLADQLTDRDRVSIVVYAGMDQVLLEGVPGDQKAQILGAIYDLEAGGGTNGSAGILTAYAVASKYAGPGVNSRVILATDGDFNIGVSSESELTRLIETKRDSGVFLTVLGFGYGNLKDNNLEALADHGNGNAAYVDTIFEARRALVEEMGATLHAVAKDVKIQVEFNPAVVEAYRLIGYETRLLNAEDFADDAKDGGEMGAGHCVTALYELIPAGAGAVPEIPLTYQRAESTGSGDYATIHVRYKEPTGSASSEITRAADASSFTGEPDADFRLASAVAAFSQMLSGSKFAGNADQAMILDILRPLLSDDKGGRVVELADLVRTSEGLYQRK